MHGNLATASKTLRNIYIPLNLIKNFQKLNLVALPFLEIGKLVDCIF